MLVAVFIGITVIATEGQEVVVLSTRAQDGSTRQTRVWVADADGAAWIESANSERELYADIRRSPAVSLYRDGKSHLYLARSFADAEGNQRIRSLLREKYGWADRWLQQLVDTSKSIAVRLDPPPNFMAPRRQVRGPAPGAAPTSRGWSTTRQATRAAGAPGRPIDRPAS